MPMLYRISAAMTALTRATANRQYERANNIVDRGRELRRSAKLIANLSNFIRARIGAGVGGPSAAHKPRGTLFRMEASALLPDHKDQAQTCVEIVRELGGAVCDSSHKTRNLCRNGNQNCACLRWFTSKQHHQFAALNSFAAMVHLGDCEPIIRNLRAPWPQSNLFMAPGKRA